MLQTHSHGYGVFCTNIIFLVLAPLVSGKSTEHSKGQTVCLLSYILSINGVGQSAAFYFSKGFESEISLISSLEWTLVHFLFQFLFLFLFQFQQVDHADD